MMGIMVPETCWASNKSCNKYHLLHLVGILFPHKYRTLTEFITVKFHVKLSTCSSLVTCTRIWRSQQTHCRNICYNSAERHDGNAMQQYRNIVTDWICSYWKGNVQYYLFFDLRITDRKIPEEDIWREQIWNNNQRTIFTQSELGIPRLGQREEMIIKWYFVRKCEGKGS